MLTSKWFRLTDYFRSGKPESRDTGGMHARLPT
jgi:hypothetical protein